MAPPLMEELTGFPRVPPSPSWSRGHSTCCLEKMLMLCFSRIRRPLGKATLFFFGMDLEQVYVISPFFQ